MGVNCIDEIDNDEDISITKENIDIINQVLFKYL